MTSGRPLLYGEPTQRLNNRLPVAAIHAISDLQQRTGAPVGTIILEAVETARNGGDAVARFMLSRYEAQVEIRELKACVQRGVSQLEALRARLAIITRKAARYAARYGWAMRRATPDDVRRYIAKMEGYEAEREGVEAEIERILAAQPETGPPPRGWVA